MRILFIKENREIEKKNVSVANNEFKVNGKIYLVSNPNYYYSKLGKDKFSKKMILVYRENQPLPIQIGSENSIKNQLNYEITNDLIYSSTLKMIFNPQNQREIIFLFIAIILFGIGVIIGKV